MRPRGSGSTRNRSRKNRPAGTAPCGCLNWQTTGSVNAISPTLCRHEQMLMPIADRLGRELYRQRNPYFLHKHYNAASPVLSMIEDALRAQERPCRVRAMA
jgi:hypothetical protein